MVDAIQTPFQEWLGSLSKISPKNAVLMVDSTFKAL